MTATIIKKRIDCTDFIVNLYLQIIETMPLSTKKSCVLKITRLRLYVQKEKNSKRPERKKQELFLSLMSVSKKIIPIFMDILFDNSSLCLKLNFTPITNTKHLLTEKLDYVSIPESSSQIYKKIMMSDKTYGIKLETGNLMPIHLFLSHKQRDKLD